MTIEKCYGQIKRRFAKLKSGFEFVKPSDTANCIVAVAVCHNICKRNYEDDYDGDETIFDDNILFGPNNNDNNGATKREHIARNLL